MFEKAKTNDEVLRLIRLREEAQSEVATRIAEARKEEQDKAEKREQELEAKANAEKRESAVKLFKMGLSVEQVAEALSLSIEEVNQIKKKIQ